MNGLTVDEQNVDAKDYVNNQPGATDISATVLANCQVIHTSWMVRWSIYDSVLTFVKKI